MTRELQPGEMIGRIEESNLEVVIMAGSTNSGPILANLFSKLPIKTRFVKDPFGRPGIKIGNFAKVKIPVIYLDPKDKDKWYRNTDNAEEVAWKYVELMKENMKYCPKVDKLEIGLSKFFQTDPTIYVEFVLNRGRTLGESTRELWKIANSIDSLLTLVSPAYTSQIS